MSADTRLIRTSVTDETVRLLAAARDTGVVVRVLGGMGIVLHVGEELHPAFQREIGDIDLATSKRGGRQVSEFLSSQGYAPNKAFNTMNGNRSLLFYDEPNRRQIDVFVGTFEMCHDLPLDERLELEPLTLPLAELMLTKLQIVKLNRKDAHDLYALLLTHEVSDHDRDAINGAWIGRLCGQDWGLCHTAELNLARLNLTSTSCRWRRRSSRSSERGYGSCRRPSSGRRRRQSGGSVPESGIACAGMKSPRRSKVGVLTGQNGMAKENSCR